MEIGQLGEDRRALLAGLRDHLAGCLDAPDGVMSQAERTGCVKQLAAIARELDEMPRAESSPLDQLAARRAARIADASAVASG